MDEQEDFFSRKHKTLLNLSTWANYIAWMALILAFILPVTRYIQIQNSFQYQSIMTGQSLNFTVELKTNLVYALSVLVDLLDSFLNGFIYFLVSRGIYLGLNMIVETDINYREQKKSGREV